MSETNESRDVWAFFLHDVINPNDIIVRAEKI